GPPPSRASGPAGRPGPPGPPGPVGPPGPPARVLGGVAAGLAVVMLGVAGGGAMDVRSLPVVAGSAATTADGTGEVRPTGRTTTADVTVRGMRFSPATIDVPVGERPVIRQHNTGPHTHHPVLETGAPSDRPRPARRD